ncbi:MATE family efflux transporter [Paroceanicella profunda]|uniref:MATE family efflux transporter n=1 Tax=Paroceanicella profunda TaxID=2579971 RepID=A0A5B8FXE9_9RHOB|nr:MATE family efflux transporter [Paroceanicella profunda]QDL91890.1 MATE family efflux transporter [Paroceanicella profunda]
MATTAPAAGPRRGSQEARRRLLDRPLATLFRLCIPGMGATLIQSVLVMVEGAFLGHAGPVPFAAASLVFPCYMLSLMLAGGAIGGAISGAIARALGAGDLRRANVVLRLALLIAASAGLIKTVLILGLGRMLFSLMGGEGPVLDAAVTYSQVLFSGIVLLWLYNMMGAALRGSGDMVRPLMGSFTVVSTHFLCIQALRFAPESWAVPGAAGALVLAYAAGCSFLAVVLSRPGRELRLSAYGWGGLSGAGRLLRAGMLAGGQSTITILYAIVVTAAFGRFGPEWLAGYGIGARLELTVIPIIFGVGGSLMVVSGTLLGAGKAGLAVRTAWTGALLTSVAMGVLGSVLALWPQLWWSLFTTDPDVAAAASAYLGRVSPLYFFFGLGLCLYCASQGLETLAMPVLGAVLRFVIVAGGIALLGGAGGLTPDRLLLLVAVAMTLYGVFVAVGLHFGAWRKLARG